MLLKAVDVPSSWATERYGASGSISWRKEVLLDDNDLNHIGNDGGAWLAFSQASRPARRFAKGTRGTLVRAPPILLLHAGPF